MSFGELVFSAVRRQKKVKTVKTNHSIVQGCISKKQESGPARTVIRVI